MIRRLWRALSVRTFTIVLLALAISIGTYLIGRSQAPGSQPAAQHSFADTKALSRQELRHLLDARSFTNLTRTQLTLPVAGQLFQIETTLDVDLQNFLLERIDREHSRHVGIVVMDPANGRLLAMAGFDRLDPSGNPCLRSDFPAASIFKIVTAAAAVDQYGYAADSPMPFSGAKHTLYKRQLTDKVDRYTTIIPLREAFADSVNPVFGKLGGLRLRKPLLEKAAGAFGFNAPLDFEIPCPPSHFQVSDEPYNWAEAASGFNLETTISPLHGAVMASAVLNGGRMVNPSLIERIVDHQGQLRYRREPSFRQQQAMSSRAAAALVEMMETTITSGTGRKAFRNHRQDKVLAGLQIGGKTGSIGSRSLDVRYDWFVGFARERAGSRQLVVAVLVGHEKFIGTRASEYARMALSWYFEHPATKRTVAGGNSPPSPAG